MMNSAQEGAYIRLLAYDWDNDGIPSDVEIIRKLSRLPAEIDIEPVVKCFTNHPRKKDFLTNQRLQRERRKQLEYRKERSTSGLRGAKKRWHSYDTAMAQPYHTAIPQPMANHGSLSLIPIPIPSSVPPIPVRANGDLKDFQDYKRCLAMIFNRDPEKAWAEFEDRAFAGLIKDPDFPKELVEIQAAYRKADRWMPQSLGKLFENWRGALDKARQPRNPDEKPAKKSQFDKDFDSLINKALKGTTP
jgi:hypothetical protein